MKHKMSTVHSAGEDEEQWNFSFVADGNIKWYSLFGKLLVKYIFTL